MGKNRNQESSCQENLSPSIIKKEKKKLYQVRNLANRPHEIIIKQKTIRWDARGINPMFPEEYKNGLPEEIINHKNFALQKKYFHITLGDK